MHEPRFLLITRGYPSNENLYNGGFIHTRVKSYISKGYNVNVFVLVDNKSECKKEIFDNISVTYGISEDLKKEIDLISPKILLIHFIDKRIIHVLDNYNIPKIIWVHGAEAITWLRRLFNFKFTFKYMKHIRYNIIQRLQLKKIIDRNKNNKFLGFVFVSNWMKKIAEKDTHTKIDNYRIIPNSIDLNTFKYVTKEKEDRYRLLLIRPFTSKKYATDIAIKSIMEMSKKHFFNKLSITIFGDGPLFDKQVKPLLKFKNVYINKKFLTHSEIKTQHDNHGIFLCPTRQDAQGVSMCEAMSSGLVAIASNNTAIPEYLVDRETGYLTDNYKGISNVVEHLLDNPNEFLDVSNKSSKSIFNLCNVDRTIQMELDYINELCSE